MSTCTFCACCNYAARTSAKQCAVIATLSATRWMSPCRAPRSHLPNACTICAVIPTAAQIATLARTATNRISLESTRSALHDDATGYGRIGWWSLRRNSCCSDHADLCRNRHLDARHYCARARQRRIANLIWNLTFHFIIFCRSKITKILMHISLYLRRLPNHTNAWVHACMKSSANTPGKKLSPKEENSPYLIHLCTLHVYALLWLLHCKSFSAYLI